MLVGADRGKDGMPYQHNVLIKTYRRKNLANDAIIIEAYNFYTSDMNMRSLPYDGYYYGYWAAPSQNIPDSRGGAYLKVGGVMIAVNVDGKTYSCVYWYDSEWLTWQALN